MRPAMTVLAPLNWEEYTTYSHMKAVDLTGTWRIGSPREEGIVPISFQMSLPKGETFSTILAKLNEIPSFDPEYNQLSNMMGHIDNGHSYLPSAEQGRALITIARSIDKPVDVEHALKDAGFRFEYDVGRDDHSIRIHRKTFRSGSLTISVHRGLDGRSVGRSDERGTDGVHLTYESSRSNGWHNLLRLTKGLMSSDQTKLIETFWPASSVNPQAGLKPDFLGTAVSMAVAAAEMFIAGGGLRPHQAHAKLVRSAIDKRVAR